MPRSRRRLALEDRRVPVAVRHAAEMFDRGEPCGPEANMAKMLASEAAWHAAEICMQAHGGFAFAEEYDVERKFRETRLYQVAPISTNLILSYVAEHLLGLPRSVRKRIVFEEVSRFLDVPGGEQIVPLLDTSQVLSIEQLESLTAAAG